MAGRDGGGSGGQRGVFAAALRLAARNFGQPADGLAQPRLPILGFRADRAQPRRAGRGCAGKGVTGGAGCRFAMPRDGGGGPRLFQGRTAGRRIRQDGTRLVGRGKGRVGCGLFGRKPARLRVEACHPRRRRGGLGRQRGSRGACPLQRLCGVAGVGARLLLGVYGGLLCRLGPGAIRAGRRGLVPGVAEFTLQQGEAVALLQAHAGGGRGSRADGVAVPSPDAARARDQHLPRP